MTGEAGSKPLKQPIPIQKLFIVLLNNVPLLLNLGSLPFKVFVGLVAKTWIPAPQALLPLRRSVVVMSCREVKSIAQLQIFLFTISRHLCSLNVQYFTFAVIGSLVERFSISMPN
jgi:hypothetical protein